jgi:hypothetical protein
MAGLGVGLGAVFCYDWRQECHALVLAHRMVRLRVRLKVISSLQAHVRSGWSG